MEPTLSGLNGLDRRFQALSDEKRIRVLELLRGGERCVCEITEALGVSQSLLSFHLKCLRDAGLVRDRREGRWVYYSVDAEGLAELRGFLAGFGPGGERNAGAGSSRDVGGSDARDPDARGSDGWGPGKRGGSRAAAAGRCC